MADIKNPIAWCGEMLKEGAQAQAFFLPIETRPKEYPALTKPMGKFWHTGIVKGDKVFETFNNSKYKVSDASDRLPELKAQKATFVPVKASTRKLKKEIKSGTSCDEFVLRSIGHSSLSGDDKGDKFPEDVFNILTKEAQLYHGTREKVERFEPRNLHGDIAVPDAVFATPSRSFAMAYSGGRWGDRDMGQSVYGPDGDKSRKMHLREMRPGAFDDIFKGQRGYMYTLPEDTFEPTERNVGSSLEVISKKPVDPSDEDIIEDVLEELKKDPNIVFHPYDIKHPETRRLLRGSIETNRRLEREGRHGYKDWWFEKAPDEIKEMWEEIEREKTAGQVFEAGGIKYDVEKLWELSKDLPTKHLATDAPDFKDYMKSRSWTGGRTPEEILRDMDDESKHMSRIKGSDLRHPVIMAPNHGIADGLHRMAKALHKGKEVIRYKQFESWDQMEPALIKKSSSNGIRMSKEASMDKKSAVGGVQPVQGVQPVEEVGGAEVGGRKQQQQQELEAWQRWSQDRNRDDFSFLLESYTPFMNYMGQRHLQTARTRGTLPPSTIKADMIQNFHRAMETYDPTKGQLNTHIGNHLRHTGRFVRTYSNIGKMPDPRSRMVWQYKDRETVLTERLGRPPSSIEMADDLGVSQKEIELLRTEIRKDIIVDPTTSGLGSIAPESPKAMEQLNFLHMELGPEQQNVLEYTYGMHGRPAVDNNEELAGIIGISPQKVRAIKRQIARRYEKRYR